MNKDQLAKRVCKTCGQYFPSQAMVKKHKVVHSGYVAPQEEGSEEEDMEVQDIRVEEDVDAPAPIYMNIFDAMMDRFQYDLH